MGWKRVKCPHCHGTGQKVMRTHKKKLVVLEGHKVYVPIKGRYLVILRKALRKPYNLHHWFRFVDGQCLNHNMTHIWPGGEIAHAGPDRVKVIETTRPLGRSPYTGSRYGN